MIVPNPMMDAVVWSLVLDVLAVLVLVVVVLVVSWRNGKK